MRRGGIPAGKLRLLLIALSLALVAGQAAPAQAITVPKAGEGDDVLTCVFEIPVYTGFQTGAAGSLASWQEYFHIGTENDSSNTSARRGAFCATAADQGASLGAANGGEVSVGPVGLVGGAGGPIAIDIWGPNPIGFNLCTFAGELDLWLRFDNEWGPIHASGNVAMVYGEGVLGVDRGDGTIRYPGEPGNPYGYSYGDDGWSLGGGAVHLDVGSWREGYLPCWMNNLRGDTSAGRGNLTGTFTLVRGTERQEVP